MINVLSNLFGALAMFVTSVYIWSKLYDSKINFKNIIFYLVGLLVAIMIIFNYFYNMVFIRIISITAILWIVNKILFQKNNNEIIISTMFSQFIVFATDVLFAIIVLYILHVDINMIPNFYGTLFANIFSLVMSIGISNFRLTKKIYDRLVEMIKGTKPPKIIALSLLVIVSLNILLAIIYYRLNIYYTLFINVGLILIYSYIVIKSLETSNKNKLMKSENLALMDSLSQYEIMLDRQRIDNHENKNQLLIIKNMIKKNDKGVIKYIDTIVKDEKEDDEILYTKVKKIPSGGLQGIIYQKMLVMKDKNINFNIDVSRDVRKIDLENFDIAENYKLCKIIGVLLDNAIEESDNIDNKHIMISLYEEDGMLVIDISNKFNGVIDLDCIDNEGYTTKGDGHGYGLSLVKKLVSESNNFINERRINKDIFKQIIKVKIK